jgi:hypothetical protein
MRWSNERARGSADPGADDGPQKGVARGAADDPADDSAGRAPDLLLTYLPHLDYDLQRHGPGVLLVQVFDFKQHGHLPKMTWTGLSLAAFRPPHQAEPAPMRISGFMGVSILRLLFWFAHGVD